MLHPDSLRPKMFYSIHVNAKGDLIAQLLNMGLGMASFDTESSGPAHDRTFRTTISAGGRDLGFGEGRTKKDAERAASEQALQKLEEQHPLSEELEDEELPTGSWPIYAQVLAESIDAAIEFADEKDSLDHVRAEASRFYRELLLDLGHGPELEE